MEYTRMKTVSAEVAAFLARLKLPQADASIILTNPTSNPVGPFHDALSTNTSLKGLGKSFTHVVAYKNIMTTYPKASEVMIENGVQAYTHKTTMSQFAQQLGMHRIYNEFNERKMERSDLRNVAFALVGYLVNNKGFEYTASFVETMLIENAIIDIKSIIKIDKPHDVVEKVLDCQIEYKILKENGRYSHSPMFEIGCFDIGNALNLLGIGIGSSIKMAQHRACMDCLVKHYQSKAI